MSQKNDLVYDIGMNNGDDTAFYLACGFRVVAVDADPHLAALAAKRFKAELEAGRLTILNVGIADQEIPTTPFSFPAGGLTPSSPSTTCPSI
jgi:16S rRNA A1518/A1519 N6-dimethyltransferase RsmA/KsgA/DIM1 with predicted DNA glycosylase/AP lyase activity